MLCTDQHLKQMSNTNPSFIEVGILQHKIITSGMLEIGKPHHQEARFCYFG